MGPYLSFLASYAIHLVQKFGENARFAFLSRDSDELSRVFRVLFPSVTSFNIDLSRRLLHDPQFDAFFRGRINELTVMVDIISTGRSFFMFADRTGASGKTLAVFLFLENLLPPEHKRDLAERRDAGKFYYFQSVPEPTQYRMFECLLQSHYPPVISLRHDVQSGGLVKSYGLPEFSQSEQNLITWKATVVSEFTRTLLRRGFVLPNEAQTNQLLQKSAHAILGAGGIMGLFPSFHARERFYQYDYPNWPSTAQSSS